MALPTPTLPEDASVRIMNDFFGPGWHLLAPGGSKGASLIFPMIEVFNTVALIFVAIIFTWSMGQGLAQSAHEGTPLGKRFSTIWMPVRMAFAPAALAPVIGGLSFFQVAILLIIGWSVHVGNLVLDVGLSHALDFDKGIVSVLPKEQQAQATELVTEVLEPFVTQYYSADYMHRSLGKAEVTEQGWEEVNGGKKVKKFIWTAPDDMKGQTLSSLTISCPSGGNNSIRQSICDRQRNAVVSMINEVSKVASDLVDRSKKAPKDEVLVKIADNYAKEMFNIQNSVINGSNSEFKMEIDAFKTQAMNDGWMFAGAYYWTLTNIQRQYSELFTANVHFNGPNAANINAYVTSEYAGFADAVQGYKNTAMEERLKAAVSGGIEGGLDGGVEGVLYMVTQEYLSQNIIQWATEQMMDEDPILVLSNLGHIVISAGWGIVGARMVMAGASGVLDGQKFSTLGVADKIFGGIGSSAAGAITSTVKAMGPFLVLAFIALMFLGIMYAFYLPAIPGILWISSVITWIILVIEALLAAPLWVAAHSMPEGDGLAGQMGSQGYRMLLTIFIRPPLMVAGLLISFAAMSIIGSYVGEMFQVFSAGMNATHFGGPVTIFAMLTILLGLSIIMAHKIFGLINWIPESISRWVGSQAFNSDGAQEERRVSSMFDSATNEGRTTVLQGMKGSGSGIGPGSVKVPGSPPNAGNGL